MDPAWLWGLGRRWSPESGPTPRPGQGKGFVPSQGGLEQVEGLFSGGSCGWGWRGEARWAWLPMLTPSPSQSRGDLAAWLKWPSGPWLPCRLPPPIAVAWDPSPSHLTKRDSGSRAPAHGLLVPGLCFPQVEPQATIAEIKNLFTKSRKSRAQPHCPRDPSGQGPLGRTLSYMPLPQGPAEITPVWPRLLWACLGHPPPCGHQQERPCWALGRTTSRFACSSGLCPGATQTSEILPGGRRSCRDPGPHQAVCCDTLLSLQIHSGTPPASPSAWTPVSTAVCLAVPGLLGGPGRRPRQALSPGPTLRRGQVPEG